jgi:predicted DNA-binding transcriptional regulator AlpA
VQFLLVLRVVEFPMSQADTVGKPKPEVTGKRAVKSGTHKAERVAAWLPRAMRVEQGAAYLSMSKSMFLLLVEEGDLPQPVRIRGMVMWDRLELDDAFEDFKNGGPKPGNTMHKILGIKP